MTIQLNTDKAEVAKIRAAVAENDGYCPCQLEKTERSKCICLNFMEGPDGWCHCGLYYKTTE